MNDIGVSSASPGADILATAKGPRSAKQGDGKGFIDALSSSFGNGRKSSGPNAGTDAAANANTTADDDADAVKTASNSASTTLAIDVGANAGVGMIDTSGANLANLAGPTKGAKPSQGAGAAALSKSLIELQNAVSATEDDTVPAEGDETAAVTGSPTPAVVTSNVSAQPATLDQLAELAQQLADLTTAYGQATPVKGDGKAPAVKGGKDAQSTDDGKSTPTQASQAANTISDALSLLNVPQPVVAAQAATAQPSKTADDAKVQGMSLGNAAVTDDASDAAVTLPDDGQGSDAAQTFRLTRSDGRGGALDLSISKSGDEAADVKVAASTGGDTPTITVLDSRRYLGLATNSNSSLVAGALAGDREWSAAMQPGSALSNTANQSSVGKVVNTLKIQLRPDNLGDVTATMRLSGGQLSVDLKVQTGEAYRQLHADQSHMVDALRAQGYQVDNITVTLASNADQQSDSGRNSGSNQQQSLLNQGQGGDARPRGQNYSGQQSDGNNGNRSSGEGGVEDGAAGGVQRSRSGAVYL
ncbi:flagellar hook-length control protein FliK [Rhizobium tropici]|uniref:Flagellar hook-length control protein FliK n=1 Tax=Rhizobium tropici TaxID=398 RepID=A0A5B0WGE7_RHITR|nr:flagellar hook-length control protein FliK [Rhizobium tropici]KAA1185926.1 flagellar hook-length control protein FliK [Rhizobium tropici]